MDNNIDFGQIVRDTLKKEFPSLLAKLDPEDKLILLQSFEAMALLSLQLLTAKTQAEKEDVQRNILHIKATVLNLQGIMKVRTFKVFLRIFEEVMMTIIKAAILSAIA